MEYSKIQRQKAYNKETRILKAKARDKSWYVKKAQAAFNEYIRHRDAKLPCISCGQFNKNRYYHAGHYITTAAQPSLRFHPGNCHKQCYSCNTAKSGNIVEYRKALIRKIGLEKVEELEKDHPPKKYTIDQLKEIRDYFKKKTKELNISGNDWK